MSKPIIIGEKIFRSKRDTLEYFKDMLAKYKDGETINYEDSETLLGLINRHPEAEQKIGCGVKRFYKALTDLGTSCFFIERQDSTITDFSYIAAVKAKEKSLYSEFKEACRDAVRPDIIKIKAAFFQIHGNNNGKVRCELSGEEVSISESVLHHKHPLTFESIVNGFLATNSIKIDRKMFSSPKDNQFTVEFVGKKLRGQFITYHNKIAKFSIIKIEYHND